MTDPVPPPDAACYLRAFAIIVVCSLAEVLLHALGRI